MRNIPTLWDETRYIDGTPGKYSIIARRSGQKWYVAGVNAEKEAKKLTIQLPMFSNQKVTMYNDKNDGTPFMETVTIPEDGELSVTIQPNGGFILK
ncbi:glycoside hydrolase family 97 C-terminal domain-containing protein [Tangfeifania diversioriginum]|nr:glycoside hydrolase family 97 C-terminal domain-containing protein [Tangfeifania diversioriginum]